MIFLSLFLVLAGTATVLAVPADGGEALWARVWNAYVIGGEIKTSNHTSNTIVVFDQLYLNLTGEPGSNEEAAIVKVDGFTRIYIWYDECGLGIDMTGMKVAWQVEGRDNELWFDGLPDSGIISTDVQGPLLRIVVGTKLDEENVGSVDMRAR